MQCGFREEMNHVHFNVVWFHRTDITASHPYLRVNEALNGKAVRHTKAKNVANIIQEVS